MSGRYSLRRRLVLGLSAIAVILVVVTASSVVALTGVTDAIGRVLEDNYSSVIACEDMSHALGRQDGAALLYVTGHDDLARPIFAREQETFRAALRAEEGHVSEPGEGVLVREIRDNWFAYEADSDRLFAADLAGRGRVYFEDMLPRFRHLSERLKQVLALNQSHLLEVDRHARRLSTVTLVAVVSVSVIALAVALWLSLWLRRSITEPLSDFVRRAKAIGEGDLSGSVQRPVAEELSQLAAAFSRMQDQLRAYRESSLGELLAARDLSRATVECLLDPVVVFGADGGVVLANEPAWRIFDLKAASADELRDKEIPDGLVRARDLVFASGAPVLPQSFAESMRYDGGGGGERHFLVRAAPLRREPGETSANAIVVAQDVTRLRRIDELKSDVVATVSHELKTPLTSLRLATYMLLEGAGPLTEQQRELATTARGDVERLRAIVDELLDLVRIEREAGALRRSRIAIATLFEDVVDGHRAIAANKGVALGVAPLDPARQLEVDAEKLSVVLSNLVANAIRHTPAGGRVELSVRGTNDASEVSLTVKDTGEGITGDQLGHVFDRHYRGGDSKTKRGDRHGLGLAIAREIVEHHGGRIEVTSRAGEGSTFTVVLPNVFTSPTSERPPSMDRSESA